MRERSLSHTALIDNSDNERLMLLAASIMPLPFMRDAHCPSPSASDDDILMAMSGVHPVAWLYAVHGIAYDAVSNPHRAVPFLRAAMTIHGIHDLSGT